MAKRLTRAQLDTEKQIRPGCRYLGYARVSGALVGVYVARDAWLDDTDGPYAVVCETHGRIVNVHTLRAALAAVPICDWCEQCMGTDGPPDLDDTDDGLGNEDQEDRWAAGQFQTDEQPAETGKADMQPITQGAHYHDNAARCQDGQDPCIVCGKPCERAGNVAYIHVYCIGPSGMAAVTSAEHETLQAGGHGGADLGCYPIGRECLKRYPELRRFVVG